MRDNVVIPRRPRRPRRGPRILVHYDPFWGYGDLLCSEPLIRGLRGRWPGAEIRFRGHPGNAGFSPEFAGEADDGFEPDATVPVRLFHGMAHEEYAKLEALPSLVDHMCSYGDVSPADRSPRLNLGGTELEWLASFGLETLPRPLVAICSDGSDVYRGWPVERFHAIALDVLARGGTVLEVGARQKLGVGLDLVGKLRIQNTAAVLSACDLFIGNNSGLFHYAQAADVPCVVFFSLALPQRFVHDRRLVVAVQHRELQCINCMTRDFAEMRRLRCRTQPEAACMSGLQLADGLAAVDRIFSEYLADCPRRGEVGSSASTFRAQMFAYHAEQLLEHGHRDRAARFYAFAAETGAPRGAPASRHFAPRDRKSSATFK